MIIMSTASARRPLKTLPVSRKADAALRESISSDNAAAFHDWYQDYLTKPRKRLRKLVNDKQILALWSENSLELTSRERELSVNLDRTNGLFSKSGSKSGKTAGPLESLLSQWCTDASVPLGSWEAVCVAEMLLRGGQLLKPETFAACLSILARGMLNEPLGGLFTESDVENDADNPLRHVIARGEAPFLCSLLLEPLGGTETLRKSGADVLQTVLMNSTDSEGIVHASLVARLPEHLAPLARSMAWARVFKSEVWTEDNETRLDLTVQRSSMLVTPPAPAHGEDEEAEQASPELSSVLELLLDTISCEFEQPLRKLLKKSRRHVKRISSPGRYRAPKENESEESETPATEAAEVPAKKEKHKSRPALDTSWQSDTSFCAVLRSSLSSDADVITVDWHASNINVRMTVGGVPLVHGAWTWSVRLDEEAVPSPLAWKCSCWFNDPECVFLELEGENTEQQRCIRQIVLVPYERFAIFTDSVTTGAGERRVHLTTSLPLAEGYSTVTDAVTRELTLCHPPAQVRVFPLWMEDDRIQHALGHFREHDGQLEMNGPGPGGVTIPLAIDWHPDRSSLPADWCRLTVTENRRIAEHHEAAGFRIRVGDFQVLGYRSLKAGANSRAVLGLHTWDETVYTRVTRKDGPMRPLVEVETPE